MKPLVALGKLGLPALLLAGLVHGQVLFTENFESYTNGSNLFGQGGWTGENTGANEFIVVGTGTFLSSIVAPRRGETAIFNISYARHTLSSALSTTQVTTLSFDAYGTTASLATEASALGIGRQTDTLTSGPVAAWAAGVGDWDLDLRTITGNAGNYFADLVPYNIPVVFEIVIDGPAGEVYGRYNPNGAGFTETAHYLISPAMIASLDTVHMKIDYQTNLSRGVAEFDNISVQAVPEPSTYALLFGLAALMGTAIRRRHLARN